MKRGSVGNWKWIFLDIWTLENTPIATSHTQAVVWRYLIYMKL